MLVDLIAFVGLFGDWLFVLVGYCALSRYLVVGFLVLLLVGFCVASCCHAF